MANRFEHLLARAKWDADPVRDEVRRYVVDDVAHPQAVLIADDTAAIKRGDRSAGDACEYCGPLGRSKLSSHAHAVHLCLKLY
ncbi:transposase [Nonomuraea sp. NPDC049714]|uniref:transposase n=1 Tax=Nonomuraea sp. NPDC049714 TaxID=3364357 RepID=UPI0037A0EAEE